MTLKRYLLSFACLLGALGLGACGTRPSGTDTIEGGDEGGAQADDPAAVEIVEYEKKTKELMEKTTALNETRGKLDEQQRRLSVICVDYPDHQVCAPQTAATFAREAFCADPEFTKHVDAVVAACHQGECKQVDQAEQITRSQYMVLTQRLPHTLVSFGAARSNLDAKDKKQLQQFLEALQGERGYIIIVGRASKDGQWRKNLQYALDRAEGTRKFLTEELGLDAKRVGYITYGHDKMYLTQLDAERLTEQKLSVKQANRSALVFAYPCFQETAAAPATTP